MNGSTRSPQANECTILARNASETRSVGHFLASTLYDRPVTIALTGELGAGKTTFLQGLASALGILGPLVSPTYALEQRYAIPRGAFLHLDLYRLTEAESQGLLQGSEDFEGVRAIEWSDRISLDDLIASGHVIHVRITEETRESRSIRVTFHDAALPSDAQIDQWRQDVLLPPHIGDHCDAVATLCADFAKHLLHHGRIVRPGALRAAARVHDLLRFLDFHRGGHPSGNRHPRESTALWDTIRMRYRGLHHEEACAAFLREHGYPVVAAIVAPHGLQSPPAVDGTLEQKLLYYADKRVLFDRIVTLDERFADFAARYGNGTVSDEHRQWHDHVRAVEREIFPEGPPR